MDLPCPERCAIILKIDLLESESIKQSLNKKDAIFSDNSEEKFISSSVLNIAVKNNISLDLLKKVIHARIDEIFNLSFKNINLEHLLLETDSPYLAPTPYRGKRNESKYLLNIAKKIAEIHHVSIEEVAKATTKNAHDLFNLKNN